MRVSFKNLIPGSGKLDGIFKGVVEDNKDPEKRGRVRIRIIGLHTNIKETSDTAGIPTSSLPWAEPVLSTFEGSISGYGAWFVPVQGSHVYLFFENGNMMQPRYFGTAAGVPKRKANPKFGFYDPDGIYPLESMLGKPDWHPLARGEDTSVYDDRKKNKLTNISTATGKKWDEPDPFYFDSKPVYPNNTVIATRGGFLFEFDGTENAQRFAFMHPMAYFEFNKDGKMILRNKADRWDICDGICYRYYKEDSHATVGGTKSTVVGEDKKTSIVKEETRTVGSEQKIAIKGTQTTSIISTQEVNVKGKRKIGIWGSEDKSVKGSGTNSILGSATKNITGMYRKNVNAICEETSAGPKGVKSSSTIMIGRGPISRATATLNSAISGFNAAVIEALQPIMDTFSAVQKVIDGNISEALKFANEELKPLTDIINDAQSLVNYVKTEYQAIETFCQTAVEAPFKIVSTVSSYVNKIVNTPGYVIQNMLNQMIGLPSQLNLLRSISSVYMSAKDMGGLGGIQVHVKDFNTLFDGIINFNGYTSLGDLDLYGRSGLSSFLGGTYSRMGVTHNDFYMTGQEADSYTTWGQYRGGSGTLKNELYQAQDMMTNTLCAAHFDVEGTFQIRSAIGALWDVTSLYTKMLNECTIEQLLGVPELKDYELPDGTIEVRDYYAIDPIILAEFGDIIDLPLLSAGGLTPTQQDMVIPTLQDLPLMTQVDRDIFWLDFYEDERSIYDVHLLGEITDATYFALQLPEESDEDFEERMKANTPIAILDDNITEEINTSLETTKTTLFSFASFNLAAISASYVELFEMLIQAEDEIVAQLKGIDLDALSWEGKDDDFTEAVSGA
jgi:hypothetical protein